MRTISRMAEVALLSVLIMSVVACQNQQADGHHHSHGHEHGEEHAEVEKGDHGGRLFEEGEFSLELQIFEKGVPPEYRIYGYEDGKILKPSDFSATVELARLGRAVETFTFTPVGDFLAGNREVSEPHSFDVVVRATFKGRSHEWKFSSYEGRVTIPESVASISGLRSEKAEAQGIRTTARMRGKVVPSEHKIAHIIPRFSGVVREGRKHIGDPVQKGEVLAVIESNESLQPFEVRSQIAGTVVNGHVIVGEFIPENQWIYVVADLSEVWADFFIPLREELNVTLNQKVRIATVNGAPSIDGVVSYVAPYADERSQSRLVRVVVANPHGEFLPGMFLVGDLITGEGHASVSVKKTALQKFRDWDVVFRKVGETYEVAPVELGASDEERIEVKSGLSPGDEYVSENAYLIKADILKAGASHDH